MALSAEKEGARDAAREWPLRPRTFDRVAARARFLTGLALLVGLAAATRIAPAQQPPPRLVVERVHASIAPSVTAGDRTLTIVRADPRHFRLTLLTAAQDGGAHTAPEWVAQHDLVAAINASMFASSGRSVGLLVDRGVVGTARDNPLFGGYLAFDARPRVRPAVRVAGRECDGFDLDQLRADYTSLVQNYRLLDCAGRAIAWADPKIYSAAAVGTDRRGRVVFVHARTPYRMAELASMLAARDLGLASLLFVEGGPEASLVVRDGDTRVDAVGSWESEFHEADDNQVFWPLPNVLGLERR